MTGVNTPDYIVGTFFGSILSKLAPIKSFLSFIPKSLGFIAKGFGRLLAPLNAFLIGWDIGSIINDMDLFGLLPMKIGKYVQKALGWMDLFVTEAKAMWSGLFGKLADKMGLGKLADWFKGAEDNAKDSIDNINNTIDSINPVQIKAEGEEEASNLAVKVKRMMEDVGGEVLVKANFVGKVNPEGPLPEIAKIAAGHVQAYKDARRRYSTRPVLR